MILNLQIQFANHNENLLLLWLLFILRQLVGPVLLYNPSQQELKQSPFVSIRGICVCFF